MTNRKKLLIFNTLLVVALLICLTALVWTPNVVDAADATDCFSIEYHDRDTTETVYYPHNNAAEIKIELQSGGRYGADGVYQEMIGWYADSTYATLIGAPNQNIILNGNLVLHALRETVTAPYALFRGNGGVTTVGGIVKPILARELTADDGSVNIAMPAEGDFVCDGDKLIGWAYTHEVQVNGEDVRQRDLYLPGAAYDFAVDNNTVELNFNAEWRQTNADRAQVIYMYNGGIDEAGFGYRFVSTRIAGNDGIEICEPGDIDERKMERAGFVFKCWNTQPDGSGTDYEPGEMLTAEAGSLTHLYAQWVAETACHKITLDPYVGDGADEYKESIYIIPGSSGKLPWPGEIDQDEHDDLFTDYKDKVFAGWYDKQENESGAVLVGAAGSEYETEEVQEGGSLLNTTLHGHWTDAANSIVYYSNDGSGGTRMMPFTAYDPDNHENTLTKLLDSGVFTGDGYYVMGWNTASDGSGQWYLPQEELQLGSRIDLYAQWQKDGRGYAVLEGNDGYFDFEGSSMPRVIVPADEENEIELKDYMFEHASSVFDRWTLNKNDTGLSFEANRSFCLDDYDMDKITLYAQWLTAGQVCTVRYYYEESSSIGRTEFIPKGATFELQDLSDEDRMLLGWYDAASGGNRVGGGGESYDAPDDASSLKFYARWQAVGSSEVGFNGNGGATVSGELFEIKPIGQSVQIPGATDFTRDGYYLAFWRDEDTRDIYLPGAAANFGERAILNAIWESPRNATVIFDISNTDRPSGLRGNDYTTRQYTQGSVYLANLGRINDIKMDGKVLAGWKDEKNNKEYVLNESMTLTPGTSIMLKPVWKPEGDYYKLEFDAQAPGQSWPAQFVFPGEYAELPEPDPRDGFFFEGWFTGSGGENVGVRAGGAGEEFQPERSMTLYAHWHQLYNDTVILNGNGGVDGNDLSARAYSDSGNDGKITLPGNIFSRVNMYIAAWSTADGPDMAAQWYKPGDEVDANGQTLYAMWAQDGRGTMFLNGNGGYLRMGFYNGAPQYDVCGSLLEKDRSSVFQYDLWIHPDGKALIGWNTAADGSGTSVPLFDSVGKLKTALGLPADTPITDDIYLYAQWATASDSDDIFTIRADTNGDGELDYIFNCPQESIQNGRARYSIRANEGPYEVFTGFYDKADGTAGAEYVCWSDGDIEVRFDNGKPKDLTVYAHFVDRQRGQYYMFNGAGGKDDSGKPYVLNSYNHNDLPRTVTVPGGFTRTGYQFLCWQGDDGSYYAPGDALNTADRYSGEFSAVWYKTSPGAVVYDANGGGWERYGRELDIKKVYAVNDEEGMEELRDHKCVKPGHYPLGWKEKGQGFSTEYYNFGKVIPGRTGLLELEMVWAEYPDKYIHYDGLGGVFDNGKTEYVQDIQNFPLTLDSNNLPKFNSQPYILKGWQAENGGGVFAYKAGTDFNINESTKLSPIWGDGKYLVYYGNGGTRSNGSDLAAQSLNTSGSDLQLYAPGMKLEDEKQADFFEKSGSIFTGWNSADDGSGDTYPAAMTTDPADFRGKELYAQWKDINGQTVYELTLDPKIGSHKPPLTLQFLSGDKMILPEEKKEGSIFTGWYDGTTLVGIGGSEIEWKSNWGNEKTLTAGWKAATDGISSQLQHKYTDPNDNSEEYALTVTVNNQGGKTTQAVVMIALYNAENEMIEVEARVIPIQRDCIKSVKMDISAKEKATRARVFLINSSGMVPLYDAWGTDVI